ncbi:MAG: STAS domain-containing protein [Lachnospiraceae bacterium]|nr:STAS domain-containing protein [Lachnospiraceae bacterium]
MRITENRENEIIVLAVEGRVDTNTSPELQDRILKSFQKGNELIMDFEELEYISSAGLRALLLGHKTAMSKGGSMTIRNVNEDVMEIFEDTGFSDILDIEEE